MARSVSQPRTGSPIRSPRVVEKRERTRAALQRSGAKLFIRHGIGAVSVEEILADVGISRRTFYGFFANKYELAASLIKPALADGVAQLEAPAVGDGAQLGGIVDCYLGLWERHGDSLVLISSLDATVMPLIEDEHRQFGTLLKTALDRAEAAGELRNGDALLTFRVLSRTAVPLLKIYADHPQQSKLFRESMLALLGRD